MTNRAATAQKPRRPSKRKTYASRVALEAAPVLLDSPAAAAKRLGTSRQQVYELLRRGALTSVSAKTEGRVRSAPDAPKSGNGATRAVLSFSCMLIATSIS
jgi:hypothetical protein